MPVRSDSGSFLNLTTPPTIYICANMPHCSTLWQSPWKRTLLLCAQFIKSDLRHKAYSRSQNGHVILSVFCSSGNRAEEEPLLTCFCTSAQNRGYIFTPGPLRLWVRGRGGLPIRFSGLTLFQTFCDSPE